MKNTILVLLLSILVFPACETRRYSHAWENPVGSIYEEVEVIGSRVDRLSSYGDELKYKAKTTEPSVSGDTAHAGRLIQYNAQLSLAVKRPDSAISKCKAIALKYEGYAQTISTSRAVIRVKSERLNEALTELAALGEVTYKNVYADDVTEQYYDWKIRLENMERARKRYLELLDKAANVQEALAVEKELERLNGEIDSIKGKISRLQHLVAYSTITINVHEKVKPGILGYPFVWLYKGVKWLFVRN